MKMEALFAIITGIIVGLGITYGIYVFRQQNAPENDLTTQQTTPLQSPTPPPSAEKLLITAPEDESIFPAPTVTTISGTAESNEMVVVFVNAKEYITQADSIGAFAVEAQLDAGSNLISITAIGQNGEQKNKKMTVVVSNASIDDENVAEDASASATPSASGTPVSSPKASPKAAPSPAN